MNKEEGIITKVEGNIAWVKVRRTSMEAQVYNPVNGKEGDRVEFMISTSSLLTITSLLYIFPLIFLMAGSISGYMFFKPPEFYALILGLSGFFISYLIIRFISERMAGHRKFTPEIIRILRP